MSLTEFNKLFAGYPDSGEVDNLRAQLHIALIRMLPQLERASTNLIRATLDYRWSLQDAVSLLDDVLMLVPDMPPLAIQAVNELRLPALGAVQVYNAAAQKRRGLLRKTNRVTQQEFDTCVKALNDALCDIAHWIKSVMPDA